MIELEGIRSSGKRSPCERISSANSLTVSTPSPIKRLKSLRERLLAGIDDWKYDPTLEHKLKPKLEPKCPTPKILSPMCSPIYLSSHKLHDEPKLHLFPEPLHFHGYNAHLCDAFHNVCPPDDFHEPKSPLYNTNRLQSPPKPPNIPIEHKSSMRSPKCDEKCVSARKQLHRSKSCPKDLFSVSSKCTENDNENEHEHEEHIHHQYHHHQQQQHHDRQHAQYQHENLSPNDTNENVRSRNESADSNWLRPHCREKFTPCYSDDFVSPAMSRQQNSRQHISRSRTIPKIRIHKPKSKTPNSMDEYISSKLVRGNLAASLRQKNSRQKINEMTEEKMKASMDVSKFIPKCHHWDVRDSPGWKNFMSEE